MFSPVDWSFLGGNFLKFSELGLSQSLLKAIKRSGYEEATPIQEQTIPMVLKGQDVIGQAQTGTGKTAAFGLPIIEHVDTDNPNIQALIISPTRELAIQTQEELYRLGKDKRVRVQVVSPADQEPQAPSPNPRRNSWPAA